MRCAAEWQVCSVVGWVCKAGTYQCATATRAIENVMINERYIISTLWGQRSRQENQICTVTEFTMIATP